MAYYTVWVTGTLVDAPKEKNPKRKTGVAYIGLETRMAKDVLDPAALDIDGFCKGTFTEPTVSALWIEKVCKAQFLIRNLEVPYLHDVEGAVDEYFNANHNGAKVSHLEITEVKKQAGYE